IATTRTSSARRSGDAKKSSREDVEIHLAPISADLASTFDWFLLIGTSSESYKQCKANEPKKHSASADNAAPEAFDPFVFFKCESIFGHENSPFLTGIATIVVGIF